MITSDLETERNIKIANERARSFLVLDDPIDEEYIEMHKKENREELKCPENMMDDWEADYALKLINQGYLVFREPKLIGCRHKPDFYIYSEELDEGVLVELTSLTRKHSNGGKKRQHDSLGKVCDICGIPFIPLFREELEDMEIEFPLDLDYWQSLGNHS